MRTIKKFAALVALTMLVGVVDSQAGLILTVKYFETNGVEVTNGILTNNIPYEIQFQLASTNANVRSKKIHGGDWEVGVLTQYVSIASAVIPSSSEDFWGAFTMESGLNRVDSTLDGTMYLTDNHRLVSEVGNGPTNKVGNIENLFFVPTSVTPAPRQLFAMSGVVFYDTNGSNYDVAVVNHSSPYWLDIPEEPFVTIVNAIPEPTTVVLFGLALLGGYAVRTIRRLQQ